MNTQKAKKDRIEFRVSEEDKALFLHAQQLSGEKTFSGYIVTTIRERSRQIIDEKKEILASQRDKEIFYEALMADADPNQKLKEAAKRFKSRQ